MIEEKPKKYFFIQYIPELVHAVGETEALLVMLLHQTLKWNGKCQVHEGKRWYWHTYQGWASYLGTRSEKSIRVAFTRLKTLGVVETRNFNTKKYDRTLWYSLNYAGLLKVLREVNAEVNNDGPNGSFYQMVLSEITGPIHKNINIRFKLKEKEAHANAVQEQTSDKPEETTGEGIMAIPEKPRLKTTAEILSAMSEKKAQQLTSLPEKTTPKSFEQVWKVEVSEMEGVHLVKNFTMQQLGQTKHFIKAVGEKEALPVLRATLRHWIRFTKKVKAAAGLKVTPDLPELGFVVKYSEHAYALFKELEGEQVQPTAPATLSLPKGKIVIRKNKPQALPDAVQAPTPPHHIPESVKSDSGAAQELQTQADDLVTLDFLAQYE